MITVAKFALVVVAATTLALTAPAFAQSGTAGAGVSTGAGSAGSSKSPGMGTTSGSGAPTDAGTTVQNSNGSTTDGTGAISGQQPASNDRPDSALKDKNGVTGGKN